MKVIKINGLVNGPDTEHDGRFLVFYDPRRPEGQWTITLRTSADITKAQKFATAAEAWTCWQESIGIRKHDGQPDRPLTAFTIEILEAP